MPKHRKEWSPEAKQAMLARMQKEDPTWDHLSKADAQKKKQEEQDVWEASRLRDKDTMEKSVGEAEKIIDDYLSDTKNRRKVFNQLQRWLRKQQHPSLKAIWAHDLTLLSKADILEQGRGERLMKNLQTIKDMEGKTRRTEQYSKITSQAGDDEPVFELDGWDPAYELYQPNENTSVKIDNFLLERLRTDQEFADRHIGPKMKKKFRALVKEVGWGPYEEDLNIMASVADVFEKRNEGIWEKAHGLGQMISAKEYAWAVLTNGMRDGWLFNPDTNTDSVKDEIKLRVRKAFEATGLEHKEFARRCFPTITDAALRNKNLRNWLNSGQIAKNSLLDFATVAGCSLDYLLGAPIEEVQREEGLWSSDPETTNVVQLRPVETPDNKEEIETLLTVPVLEGEQLLNPEAAIAEFQESPEKFQTLSSTNLLDNHVNGVERYAVAITHEWYAPEFKPGDFVFFATDIVPDLDDFVFMARRHETKTNNRWQTVGGFFRLIGNRPDKTAPEDFFNQGDGVSLCANKGQRRDDDPVMMKDDGWEFVLVGVAVDMRRPLLRDRMERMTTWTKRMASQYDERSAKAQRDLESKQQVVEMNRAGVAQFRRKEKKSAKAEE